MLEQWLDNISIDVIIITGFTGITGRDVTPRTKDKVKEKDIPKILINKIFRYISLKKLELLVYNPELLLV